MSVQTRLVFATQSPLSELSPRVRTLLARGRVHTEDISGTGVSGCHLADVVDNDPGGLGAAGPLSVAMKKRQLLLARLPCFVCVSGVRQNLEGRRRNGTGSRSSWPSSRAADRRTTDGRTEKMLLNEQTSCLCNYPARIEKFAENSI